MVFVDYEKAFDSVEHEAVIKALSAHQVPQVYIDTLIAMYSSCTSQVKVDSNLSSKFPVRRGVRQGDTLSPNMFNAGLEQVFQKLDWEDKGISINGEKLNHLRFADDIDLVSHTAVEAQEMLNQLNVASSNLGLKINMKKTKVMFNSYALEQVIRVDGQVVQAVEEYVYLGQQITMSSDRTREIQRRISAGWLAFAKYRNIMKSNIPICLKRKVYNQCIQPAITYGCQVWAMTKRMQAKLQTTQRSMERAMIGVTKRDHKTNKWIREKSGLCDIMETIKKQKWCWAGHVARMNDGRWTKRTTEWIPLDKKRERARPKTRWSDEIRKFVGNTWMRAAQNRNEWKIHGKAFVQQWTDNGY
jgi:hypothetical protein